MKSNQSELVDESILERSVCVCVPVWGNGNLKQTLRLIFGGESSRCQEKWGFR